MPTAFEPDMSCIFCRIVDGDLPSRTVYETDDAVAFLDANPLAAGHTLVVPREHYETVGELPPETAGAVFEAVSAVTPRVERATDADGTTVAVNNGAAAGQEVPHTHVHVVPRFDGDGNGPIHRLFSTRPSLSDADLDAIAADIRGATE
jgi:histidine triad (HIT) family protein